MSKINAITMRVRVSLPGAEGTSRTRYEVGRNGVKSIDFATVDGVQGVTLTTANPAAPVIFLTSYAFLELAPPKQDPAPKPAPPAAPEPPANPDGGPSNPHIDPKAYRADLVKAAAKAGISTPTKKSTKALKKALGIDDEAIAKIAAEASPDGEELC